MWRSGLLLVIALSCCVFPATAKDLLIYGPGGPSPNRARAAAQRARLLAGVGSAETYHVSEVPVSREGTLWVVGGLDIQYCDGAPSTSDQVRAKLDEAIARLDALDDAAAERLFGEARQSLLCLDEVVEPSALWSYHFHRGVLAFNRGYEDLALAYFVDAVLANPGTTWDENYSPDARLVFLQAREQYLMRGEVHLEVHDPEGSQAEILIDGQPSASPSSGFDLFVGPHLVQYRPEGGELESFEIVISEDHPAILMTPSGVRAAVTQGPRGSELVASDVVESLAAFAAARGATRVLIAPDDLPEQVYVLDVEHRQYVTPEQPTGTDRWRRRPGPRVGIAVAGGPLLQRSSERGSRDLFGMLHVGVDIRLVRGLSLDLALSLAMAAFVADDRTHRDDVNLVPLLGVGARYTFGYTVVRPYVGIRGAIRPNEVSAPLGGVVGSGGVVVLPVGALRLQVELSGGWVGVPHAAISGGAGLAF